MLLVLAGFLALTVVYSWAIPPLEGSDEYEHFAYINWLITERRFPIQGEAGWESPVRQESGQPPLYYLLASLPARLSDEQPPVVFRPNPYFRYDLDPTRPDNKNTALHYPEDTGCLLIAAQPRPPRRSRRSSPRSSFTAVTSPTTCWPRPSVR
ncbi:MAG: hypothetical protein DCC51_17280 [Anaerolineae bacterium]|nr:MAG: hypothetical protein DCC51_17280 [Anaerolineae bacterium]